MSGERRLTTLLGHLKAAGAAGNVTAGRHESRDAAEYSYTLADSCSGVLSPEQRRAYEEDGFLVVRGLVPQDKLDTYRERFLQICNKEVTVGH